MSLEKVKPGDRVVLRLAHLGGAEFGQIVNRVTKKQVILMDGSRFRKKDGTEVGSSGVECNVIYVDDLRCDGCKKEVRHVNQLTISTTSSERKAKRGSRCAMSSLENVKVGDVLRIHWRPWQKEPEYEKVSRLTEKHVVTLVVMQDGRKMEHLWRKDNGYIYGDYGGFTKPRAEPMEDTDNE